MMLRRSYSISYAVRSSRNRAAKLITPCNRASAMIHQTYLASGSTCVVTALSMPMRTRLGICTCTIRPAKDRDSDEISSARCALTRGRARRNQDLRTSGWMDALGARRDNRRLL